LAIAATVQEVTSGEYYNFDAIVYTSSHE